jgi:hypothetical protein
MAVNYSPRNYGAPRDYPAPLASPGLSGYAEEADAEERPLGTLFSNLGSQLSFLLQKEVELAKLEVQDQATKAAKAGAVLGATAVVAFLASILVSFAAAWGLAEVMPTGLAFLVVGVVYAIVAGILFALGRRRLRQVRPVPVQTVKTLKDDVDVARSSVSLGMSGPPSHSPSGRELSR